MNKYACPAYRKGKWRHVFFMDGVGKILAKTGYKMAAAAYNLRAGGVLKTVPFAGKFDKMPKIS